MSPKPREMWEKGYPLDVAVLNWADKENLKIYEQPYPIQKLTDYSESSFGKTLAKATSYTFQVLQYDRNKAAALERMREHLLTVLFNDELYAYGFPLSPSTERTPRLISSEFWDYAEVDWPRGSAWDDSASFHRIRIINPYDYPDINLKPKVGRKTFKDDIYQTLSELSETHTGFHSLSNKEKTALIRKTLESKNPNLNVYGPGLGDDAIRKHITAFSKQS